jgi:hypothetical protein
MGHFAKAQSYGNRDVVSEFNTVNVVPFPVRATDGPASLSSISIDLVSSAAKVVGRPYLCGDWKLHEYFEDGGLELYNLKDDISEKNNLIDHEVNRAGELHAMLKVRRKHTNASVPDEPNPEYEPEEFLNP